MGALKERVKDFKYKIDNLTTTQTERIVKIIQSISLGILIPIVIISYIKFSFVYSEYSKYQIDSSNIVTIMILWLAIALLILVIGILLYIVKLLLPMQRYVRTTHDLTEINNMNSEEAIEYLKLIVKQFSILKMCNDEKIITTSNKRGMREGELD